MNESIASYYLYPTIIYPLKQTKSSETGQKHERNQNKYRNETKDTKQRKHWVFFLYSKLSLFIFLPLQQIEV